MTTLAIVVSLVGQAWAENANGERRVLQVGDQLAVDETLIMEEGARIDLDFGDNQQLTFLGEQQVTAEERGEFIEQTQSLAELESSEQPEPDTPTESGQGASAEGHSFVQLVRIGEIIEADGYTPVTVARIQEVLRPFGLSLPQQDFVRGSERDGTRYDEESYPETGSKLAQLSISIDTIAGNDIVDATEAGQVITVTGKVGGGVTAGDTVTVTVNNQLYSTTVNADGKTWQVDVPGSELAKDSKVQATVNSVEPNGTPVSESTERPYLADDKTPDATVELEPGSGPNGEYNNDDTKDGKVTGTVTFDPNTTEPGDTVKITDKDGNVIIERPITQGDIDNGITVDVPVADGQTDVELNADLNDPAGNASSTGDSKQIDDVTPGLDVGLEPGSGPNGEYNDSDTSDGKVEGTITFDPNTTQPGDKITATDKDGNPILDANGDPITDYEITQGDIDNGITVDVPVQPGDTDVELNVEATDPAGNTSTDSDNKPVDNLPPETVTPIADQTSDDADVVSLDISGNFNDLVSGGDISYGASGLPDGLSIDPNTGVISGTIDKSASQFGGNGEHTVTVTVTDEAGNSDDVNFNWAVNNPAPVAVDDTALATEDQTLTVSAADGVLANDSDPDGDTPLVVTDYTINGQPYNAGDTATMPGVGQITLNADGSYEFVPEADYNGAVPAISYTVEDADGGTDTGELVIAMDPVLDIALSAPAQVNEGDKITLTASVETPVQGSTLYVVLDNGQTITIPVGAVSGTTELDSRPDDEYVQGQTNQTFEVASASGGNETINSSSFGASATVGIEDADSTVTARLAVDKTSTEEGATDLVYTVTLEDANGNAIAANNDVTVVTTQGSITITAGSSTGTLDVAVQGDDAYIDGETVSNEITGVSEANAGAPGSFENLGFDGATLQTVVKDTIDPVYAIIEVDNDAVLEGGALNYTVKLVDANGDPAPAVAGKDVTVNLDWSGAAANTADVDALPASVTINGGSDTTSFVVNTNSDTVAELSESITVTIDSVADNAGTDPGFEDLQVGSNGNSAAAQVIDAPSIKVLDDNGAADGQLTVNEQGLDTNDGSNTVSGVLRITAPSGLQSIEIGGQTFTLAQIENLAGSNQTITIAGHGEITLKASSVVETASGQDAVWEIDFDYELTDAQTHTGQGADDALKDIPLGVSVADPQDASNSVTGSGNLGVLVKDDVPQVDLTGVKLDEAQVEEAQIGTPGGAEAVVDFSGAFDIGHGADGDNGVAYELVIDSNASGLVDTASGDAVELFDNNGVVEGLNSNGDVVFTIAVDGATGEVTLVQNRALAHQDPLTPSDAVKITNGAISLKATATDSDSDTDSAKVNIGDRFVFQDDGPTAVADSASVTEGGSTNGNVLIDDAPGSDGWANNGNAVVGVVSGGGSAAENANVGQAIAGAYGTLTLSADGSYTYQANPDSVSANAEDVFTYTVKDGDGDLVETTLTINVADVSLSESPITESVNESGLAGGSTEGDSSQIASGQVTLPAGAEAVPQTSVTTGHGEFSIDKDGNYTYTLTGSTDGDAVTDSFEYTSQDANGNTVTNTVTINIADDQPTAVADTGSVDEGATLTVGAGSGVLGNDQSGADGWDTTGAVAGVAAGDTQSSGTVGVGGRIDGQHGYLVLNADGSYDYVATANDITADAQDVFTYTVRDADGDLAHTTLTINVADVTLAQTPITETVNESGLAGGSTEGDNSQAASGQVTLPAGVEAIPQTNISTEHGEFSIDKDGNYTFTLTNSTDGDSVTESFTYETQDANGNTVTNTVTINVADDEPVANNDSNSINEDAGSVTGNVIGGSNASVNDVADKVGADGASVTGIASTNEPGNTPTSSTGNLVIEGEFGTLTINPDGTYSYELDNNNLTVQGLTDTESLTESFTYTLQDGDSDTTAADLDITINGSDDGVTVTVPVDNTATTADGDTSDQVVFESGLASGSDPNAPDTQVASSFTLKALDGVDATEAVTLGYTDASGNPANLVVSQSDLENLGTANQTVTTEYGDLVLSGYSQAADGTITVDYEYTLNAAPAVNDTDTNDAFGITVKDRNGDSDNQNLNIRIVDDAPAIEGTGATLADVQVSEAALDTPASSDFSGAFSETAGADGGTVTYELAVDNATSGLIDTASGQAITLVDNNGVIEGRTTTGNDLAFTVAVDANGNVTLEQNRAVQHSDTNTPSDVVRIPNGSLSLKATITDGDGDTDSASVAIGDRFAFQDDGPVATDDAATIDEDGATSVTGNVIGGSNASANDVADEVGADGASVTGVTSTNAPGNTATDSGGVLTLDGEYGTLTINPDGTYSYAPDSSNADVNALKDGDTLPESFTYTLTDGDGDTSTADLTITINGNTDGTPAITAEDVNGPDDASDIATQGDLTVEESGLVDGSGAHTGTGSIDISAADGLESLTAGGKPISLSDLQALNTGTPGSHIIINTDEGQLTLTNFNATGNVGGVPTAGELTYNYELTDLQNTPADPTDADVGRNSNDTIALEVTDAGGATSQSDLIINIIDDAPRASIDTGTVIEGDTLTVSANDGVLSNDNSGADGWDTSGGVVGVVAGSGSGTTDDATTVGTVITGTYGDLTLNADGSYSYESTADAVTGDEQDIFTYTVKDGDGDLVETTLTIDVSDVTGTAQTTTATVDEAGLANGTDAGSESNEITNGQLTLDNGWTVNGAQSGTTANGSSWSVAADGTFSYELSGATTEGSDDTDSFTYEVVDEFGNTVTNIVNINIADDTPEVVITGTTPGSLTVDESDFSGGSVSSINANFVSNVFGIKHGADGADGVVYSVEIASGNPASGVTDTATGTDIYLFMDGSDVVGRVGNNASGDIAFRIEIDPVSGAATLTQDRPLEHPDSTNPDDALSLDNSSVKLKATAKDGDGDTDSASEDVGGQFTFKDDGPSIDATPMKGSVDEAYLVRGSEGEDTTKTTVSNSLNVDFGTDGAGDVKFTDGATDSTTASLTSMGLESGGTVLKYSVSADGHTLIAYKDGESTSNPVFTVEITDPSGTPGYDFTLNQAIDHINGFGDSVSALNLEFGKLQVTDGDDDTTKADFVVTVIDDAPDPLQPQTETVDEDSTNTFQTNADATASNTTIGDGSNGTIKPSHGTVSVNSDGTINYEPDPNYSGDDEFTYTTITDNEEKTYTVDVTVNPVADAPDMDGPGASIGGDVTLSDITTAEDTAAALGLHVPIITDDANGTGNNSEAERLGEITLTLSGGGHVENVKLSAGVDGSSPAVDFDLPGNGTVDIWITDIAHPADLTRPAGALEMTSTQYESLQLTPAEHRSENIDISITASSYEVDGVGNIATVDGLQVAAAESEASLKVYVQAATDDAELVFDTTATSGITDVEAVSYTSNTKAEVTINEDAPFKLNDILQASFEDLDGSEVRSITIENTTGETILVDGTSLAAGASRDIDAKAGNAGQTGGVDSFPDITLGGTEDFSGDLKGINVTINAQDKDSDGFNSVNEGNAVDGVTEADTTNNSIELDLSVKPVAGDVDLKAGDITTPEDTAVAFMDNIEVTDENVGGSTEVITRVAFELPTDWELTGQPTAGSAGDAVWSVNGDGSTANPYTIEFSAGGEANRELALKQFEITPPAHSSKDETIDVTVTTTDTNTVDGSPQTSAPVDKTLNIPVEVTAVAERTDKDTDGANGNDVTMTPGRSYTTAGEEDTWFKLGEEGGFKLGDNWTNEDSTTELTFAQLTPVLIAGDGSIADANGSGFRYKVGGDWVEETFGGDPINVPVDYLGTLEFKAAKDFSGSFEIEVEALTRDYDEDDIIALGKTSIDQLTQAEIDGLNYIEDTSGSATLENVLIEPKADVVTTTVTANVKGNEDEQMPLSIRPKSSDPSETFNVTVSDIPEGSTITYDGQVIDETTTGIAGITVVPPANPGEKWSIEFTDFDAIKGDAMTMTAPKDSNESFVLGVSTVSVDTLEIPGDPNSPYVNESAPQNLQIRVSPKGVADEADVETVDVASQNFTEESVETNGGIKLTDLISKAELSDDDGSETLTFKVDGLPDGFGLDMGTVTVDGTWSLTAAQLQAAKITTPENFSGDISFDFTSVTTENDGDSLSTTRVVDVQVDPTPEATINLGDSVLEDTSGNLSFAIKHQNGDTDERLDEVWIKASDADNLSNMGLTFGQNGVSLADAAADAGETDITLEGGWYKLSNTAINNIYAQGNANWSGDESFGVHYVITDPAQYPEGSPNPSLEQSQGFDDSYQVTIAPDTDTPELAITSNSNISMTAEGTTTVDLSITNQGGDYDGSEALTRIVLEDVPDGVTVQGAEYLGDGTWLFAPGTAFNSALTPGVTLDVGQASGGLTDHKIRITVVGEDSDNGDKLEADKEISLSTNFTGTGPGDQPAKIETWEQSTFEPTEDTAFTLNEAITGKIEDGVANNQFTVTLKDLPAGTEVTGMEKSIIHGETVWSATGTGDDADLQALLDSITVKPPKDWNSNKGDFEYNAKLTTYLPGSVRFDEKADINQQVDPVTDDAAITITATGDEGSTVDVGIDVSNSADDPNWTLVDGKLYLTLNEPAGMQGGELQDAGGNTLSETAVTGVPGVADGNYYVVNVDTNNQANLKYQPKDGIISGDVGITAAVVGQEAAAGTVTNTESGVIEVKPVNSGYDFNVDDASGTENTLPQAAADNSNLIEVSVADNGLIDTDGSEEKGSVLLKDLPNGFLVYAGADAASATLADNIGADGNTNTWLLGVGEVPGYIGILPPANWSGALTGLGIVVNSKESALDSVLGTEHKFGVTVEAVANSITINPTASFGDEGDIITLNLNAEMEDLQEVILNAAPGNPGPGDPADGSIETATLQLKGLGEHASFYIGDELISNGSMSGHSVSYDDVNGVYTIEGLSQDDLGKLGFVQAENAISSIEVRAQTVESANNDTSAWTHAEAGPWASVSTNISKQFVTSGDDTLLWNGSAIDGRAGDDTIQLRFDEDVSASDLAGNLSNIETIDLGIAGSNAIGSSTEGLSAQDVLDMTDSRDVLTIDGDSEDSVSLDATGLTNGWETTGNVTGGYVSYTNTDNSAVVNIAEDLYDNGNNVEVV